jgi:hypothetical protein
LPHAEISPPRARKAARLLRNGRDWVSIGAIQGPRRDFRAKEALQLGENVNEAHILPR